MPGLQSVERLAQIKWVDSELVKSWRDKVRAQAISALSLARNPDYIVFGVRNSRGTLLGLIAIQDTDEAIIIKHWATRDTGREINAELINAVIEYAGKKRIKSTFPVPNWRRVGSEYWSN